MGGLGIGIFSTYFTVKTYYQKRKEEQKERQRVEIERLEARQQEEIQRYADAEKKKYAAERDFNHLKNSFAQLSETVKTLHGESELRIGHLETDLKELKGMLNILILHAGGTQSGIMRYLQGGHDDHPT